MTDPRAASHMSRIPANAPTHIAEDVKMAFAFCWREGEDRRHPSEPDADVTWPICGNRESCCGMATSRI